MFETIIMSDFIAVLRLRHKVLREFLWHKIMYVNKMHYICMLDFMHKTLSYS